MKGNAAAKNHGNKSNPADKQKPPKQKSSTNIVQKVLPPEEYICPSLAGLWRFQPQAASFYDHHNAQYFIATIIFANFFTNCIEKQAPFIQ